MSNHSDQQKSKSLQNDNIPIGIPLNQHLLHMNPNQQYMYPPMHYQYPPHIVASNVQMQQYKNIHKPPNLPMNDDSIKQQNIEKNYVGYQYPQHQNFNKQQQYYSNQQKGVQMQSPPNLQYQHPNQHEQPSNDHQNSRHQQPYMGVPIQNQNQYMQYPPQYYQQVPVYAQPVNYPQYNQQMYYQGNMNPNMQGYQHHEEDHGESQQVSQWEKKFFIIGDKFVWQYQRFQQLRNQYQELCEQMNTVDSQEDWNELKQHHEELMEKIAQIQEQLGAIISDNQILISERENQYGEVWQHRYQQLLAQFKLLQQQNAQLQQALGGNNQQALLKQHEQLQLQYRQLQNAYTHTVNELKQQKQKDEDTQQLNDYRQKLQYALEEAQKYKHILDELHEQNQQLKNGIQQYEQQINLMKRQLNSRSKVDKNQYQQLLELYDNKQRQLSKMQMQKQDFFRENKSLHEQLSMQKQQIQHIRNIINDNGTKGTNNISQQYLNMIQAKNQQINQYKAMLQDTEDYKVSIQEREDRLTKQYQEKIAALQKDIKKLENKTGGDDNQKSSMSITNAKLESYDKKLKYYEQEVANLADSLSKKNQQLVQLRGMTYEVQKSKALYHTNQSLLEQRDELRQCLKNKSKQNENLRMDISQLQVQLKEASNKKTQITSRSLLQQIETLNEALTRKQFELQKLRQTIQNKQNQITQLQIQTNKHRNKIISVEKSFEHQRQSFRTKTQYLESRNNQLDKKLRHIQFEYGDTMKNNLQAQINNLRMQNLQKQQQITKLENDDVDIKSKMAAMDRIKKDAIEDARQLRNKIDQYQTMKFNYLNKIQKLSSEIDAKDREVKGLQMHQITLNGQFNSLKSQIAQHQSTLRTKNQLINKQQEQIKSLNKQINYLQKDNESLKSQTKTKQQNYYKDIQTYKQRSAELQARIDQLARINQQIKSRAESIVKNSPKQSPISFYKSEFSMHERNIDNLNNKVKKLLEENISLKQTLNQINSKNARQYEHKFFELQTQISQLTRKVRILQMQKSSLNNEKSNIQHQLSQAQSNNRLSISNLQQTIYKLQLQLKHHNKENTYQKQSPKKIEKKYEEVNYQEKYKSNYERANQKASTSKYQANKYEYKDTKYDKYEFKQQVKSVKSPANLKAISLMKQFQHVL